MPWVRAVATIRRLAGWRLHDAGIVSSAVATDDDADNCAYAANASQLDSGGIGAGSSADGIGDTCQCGDVTGDGRVTVADAVVISRSLLVPPTESQTMPLLCDVGGSPNPAMLDCTLADAVIVRRALLSPPTASIQSVCGPAHP